MASRHQYARDSGVGVATEDDGDNGENRLR